MRAHELLPVIALVSIVTVEWGGRALLSITTGKQELSEFKQRFLRAGHAHAGVLFVLALVYFLYLPRAGFSSGVEWGGWAHDAGRHAGSGGGLLRSYGARRRRSLSDRSSYLAYGSTDPGCSASHPRGWACE